MKLMTGISAYARRFARCQTGSATAEYALLVALIAGSLVVGYDFSSSIVRDPFERLAGQISTPSVASLPSVKAPAPAAGVPAQPAICCPDGACIHASAAQKTITLLRPLIMCTGLAIGGILWCSLYNRRERSQKSVRVRQGVQAPSARDTDALYEKRQQLFETLSCDHGHLLAGNLQAHHLQSDRLTIVSPSTPADQLRGVMEGRNVRHLVVCEPDRSLLGVISDRDLSMRKGATAADLMTRSPIFVMPETPASMAVSIMVANAISCLPVVGGGKVVGVLTTTDVLLVFQCTVQLLARMAQELREESPEETPVDLEPASV